MSDSDSAVNAQIVDALAEIHRTTTGAAPAVALGVSYQALTHAMALSMQNATQTQGGMQQIGNSATSAVCAMLLELGKRERNG